MDKFKSNDKVYVIYHGIYLWLFKIFQPPACGRIIKKSNERKYHHFTDRGDNPDGLCDWYWVKCVNCIFPILIPETCIEDLTESIDKGKMMFEALGKPDCSQIGAYSELKGHESDKIAYLNQ